MENPVEVTNFGNNASDPTDQTSRSELNPLQNPTLGKNLGRWAQVYFTNPPEKREQAVVELLRELEKGTATVPNGGSGGRIEGSAARCPVCQRWRWVERVPPESLTPAERAEALERRDTRIP